MEGAITYGKKKVADIMCRKHGQANVGKVEAVAEPDEGHAEDMVHDKLLEVLARGLHAKHQHDGLLGPEGGLEQVVELDHTLVGFVRVRLVHAARVEVPHGCAAHDVHTHHAQRTRVQGHVNLLHEANLLATGPHTAPPCQWPDQLLHDELARERKHHRVEGHKGKVPASLCILDGFVRRR